MPPDYLLDYGDYPAGDYFTKSERYGYHLSLPRNNYLYGNISAIVLNAVVVVVVVAS